MKRQRKPLVYIAHPMTNAWYRHGREAFRVANALRGSGLVTPLLPDVEILCYFVKPCDEDMGTNCESTGTMGPESPKCLPGQPRPRSNGRSP